MTIRAHILLALFAGSIAISFGSMGTAQGHLASTWYPAKWPVASDQTVQWRFGVGFPSGGRSAVKNGALQWNNLNQTMRFVFESTQPDYEWDGWNPSYCADDYQQDAVLWDYIDGGGGTAAQTLLCTEAEAGYTGTYRLRNFRIRFDSAQNSWDMGLDEDVTLGALDMWSYAAHEFGHATGRGNTKTLEPTPGENLGDINGHFLASKNAPGELCAQNETDHHTMCQFIDRTKSYDRSLNTHDKDVFQAAY